MRFTFALSALSCVSGVITTVSESSKPVVVGVQRIWDKAPHNRFTDVIRFKGRWYCTFRKGQGHVSHDGVLKVIASDDGHQWDSVAAFKSLRGWEMREPSSRSCRTVV